MCRPRERWTGVWTGAEEDGGVEGQETTVRREWADHWRASSWPDQGLKGNVRSTPLPVGPGEVAAPSRVSEGGRRPRRGG